MAIEENPILRKSTESEVEFLSKVKHSNIIRLVRWCNENGEINLVYEYCKQGTLETKLINEGILSEEVSLSIFHHLLNAFKVLQENKIMHRDVKPENILLNDDNWKLADFDFCCKYSQNEKMKEELGSKFYVAPEVNSMNGYDSKCDIWSLGVVLYRMLFGSVPLEYGDFEEYLEKVGNFVVDFPSDERVKVSERTKTLLLKMLTADPLKRISWNELFLYQRCDIVLDIDKYIFTKRGKISKKHTVNNKLTEEQKAILEEAYKHRTSNLPNTKQITI